LPKQTPVPAVSTINSQIQNNTSKPEVPNAPKVPSIPNAPKAPAINVSVPKPPPIVPPGIPVLSLISNFFYRNNFILFLESRKYR